MGMVMKNCLSCNKDKDKVEVPNVPLKSLSRKVKTKIVDKYCPGTITIEENTQEDLPIKKKTKQRPLKKSICLYANKFH
jgi:hypothetical protein